ncbi:hypothetical protein K2173_014130 [Erythroxylum novogranatense]|uniref:Uncharacterized protein n=1 Tax=Erythroxylum novogranatense TaxID=1862640 RepID=A0AAV8SDT9_9ROSI|nr:hypothetical protein K2173_014130 [Erythroxylum novogranatense]
MHTNKKLEIFHTVFLTLNFLLSTCLCQDTSSSSCGKIRIPSTNVQSPLNKMILCRSQKLYFRTSLGLFQISSVDYTKKTLSIAYPGSCSPSSNYIYPSLLSAAFPTPLQPNSLLLFNCSEEHFLRSTFRCNRNHSSSCAADLDKGLESSYPCLLVKDLEQLEKGFHPKDLNCSHYSLIHRRSLKDDENQEYELGTTISFDIPDHVPNVCNECEKPNGNCGIGLRCICHPRECKNKVISMAGSLMHTGNVLSVLSSIVVVAISIIF